MSSLAELQALIARHAREGEPDTALPGVRATISLQPTQPVHHVTRPGFAIVAQGTKETLVGNRLFEYGEGDFIVTSVDLPICARIVGASPDRPYLACGLALEPAAIARSRFGRSRRTNRFTPRLRVPPPVRLPISAR